MAHGIYYDVDGRLGGPVTFIQLQLMASSGMIQPHHRVRREESDQWLPARQVKGLFSTADVASAAPAIPDPAITPTAQLAEQDTEFSFGEPEPVDDSEYNSAFNFFGEAPARPAPAPAPPPPPPPPPAPVPTKKGTKRVEHEPPAPVVPVAEEFAPPPPKGPEPKPEPKAEEPKPEPAKAEPGAQSDPKTDVVSPAPAGVEVTGQAIELLTDGTARPLDGKVFFRLTRNWLLASSRFGDGTIRAVYMRPTRIDLAIIEQRPAPPRAKGGPYSILSFRSGALEVALAFQGSDKPFRGFLEKVLLLANSGRAK